MSTVTCWSCTASVELAPGQSLGFREACERCASYLHTCKGCKFYRPGKPNDCLVPGTDPVRDREYFNFCGEFAPADGPRSKGPSLSAEDAARRLFGD